MRAALFPLVVLFLAGMAAAQDTAPPSGAFQAVFEPTPWRGPLYPGRALDRRASGLVHLCCSAQPDRRLNCRVALQEPRWSSFSEAALRYANGLLLTPDSFSDLQARPAHEFPVSIRYDIAPISSEQDQRAQQLRDQAHDLCGPGTGPAPDYIAITARIRP